MGLLLIADVGNVVAKMVAIESESVTYIIKLYPGTKGLILSLSYVEVFLYKHDVAHAIPGRDHAPPTNLS